MTNQINVNDDEYMVEPIEISEFYQRTPTKLYIELKRFMSKRKYRSRTQAVNDLLQTALVVERNIDKLGDHEFVAEIKAQMKEGGVVDYVQRLNHKDFEILRHIIETEKRARGIRD